MSSCKQTAESGYSYIEVLVAIALIAITLIPAIDSLRSGVQGSGIHRDEAGNYHWLVAKMAELRAMPYSELLEASVNAGTPTAIADAMSDAVGAERRRVVYLGLYDGDNTDADDDPFTGVDEGLIWLRVELAGTVHSLEPLVRQ